MPGRDGCINTIALFRNVLLFLSFSLGLSYQGYSQNEIKNWYFGTGTDGIVFNNNVPVKVSDKYPGVGFEGMIVVNDPVTGNLKFYCDGRTVINANHQVMTNGSGLSGHWSGAQCVQCCPIPGTCAKKFYLFTNSGYDLNPGNLSYSIIDFTNDPLGEVTNKNTPLWAGPSDEALTLVNKPNSTDYWLISNKYQTADYYVWPVTTLGVGAPVTYSFSITGSAYQMNYDKTTKKIVVTGYGNKHITLLNFDATSGVLSNEVQLGPNFGTCFAARFSPDGSKLYASTTPSGSPITTPSTLYQYDFATLVWTDMTVDGACCYAHDMKMGPDGKMYHIHTYNDPQPMAVIESPNNSAINNACNYHNITFSTNFDGEVRRFPEFITLPSPPVAMDDSINLVNPVETIDVLVNDHDYDLQNATLTIDAIEYGPKYGTATITNNKIVYTAGSISCVRDTIVYRIKGLDCATDTAYLFIKMKGTAANVQVDTSICEGGSFAGHSVAGIYKDTLLTTENCDSIVTINLSIKPKAFSTQNISICDGQSYHGHTIAGTFAETFVAANGCDSIVTTNLSIKPKSFLTQDINICQGQSYNGHTTAGTYKDTLVAANGCDSIVTINLSVRLVSTSLIDTTICKGQNFAGYTLPGKYVDTLIAANGCDSIRTIQLEVVTFPDPDLGENRNICTGDSVVLNPGIFSSYTWQDGSTKSSFVVKDGGVYNVRVTNACGAATDEVVISKDACNVYFPSAFTPNGDNLNEYFKILNPFGITDYYLAVYNRWGEKVFETKNYNKGWDGKFKGKPVPIGSFAWFCTFKKTGAEKILKGTVTLIR
ncbi:MAG: gliding motility-associated C-terminal domain-containing protein [Agriterribacter sp.]